MENKITIVGFTGHRDRIVSEESLLTIYALYGNATWVHGGAIGFDTQINELASRFDKQCTIIRPDYKKYADRPRYAPLARNRDIVEMSQIIISNYDGRTYGGTRYTVEYAKTFEDKLIMIFDSIINVKEDSGEI